MVDINQDFEIPGVTMNALLNYKRDSV